MKSKESQPITKPADNQYANIIEESIDKPKLSFASPADFLPAKIEEPKKLSTQEVEEGYGLQFASEEQKRQLEKMVIDYNTAVLFDLLKIKYKTVSVKRHIQKNYIKHTDYPSQHVLMLKDSHDCLTKSSLEALQNLANVTSEVVSQSFEEIENIVPFDFENWENHDWYLLNDRIGEVVCWECTGEKYVTCDVSECSGKHRYTCGRCGGSGDEDCSSCNGSGTDTESYYDHDDEDGGWETRTVDCSSCGGSGEETCYKCNGRGKITCKKCYGDRERYGMIDCPTCDAKGTLIYYHFIQTEITPFEQEYFQGMKGKDPVMVHSELFDKIPQHFEDEEVSTPFHTYQRTNSRVLEDYSVPYLQELSNENIATLDYKKERGYPLLLEELISHKVIPTYKMNYAYLAAIHQDYQLLLRKEADGLDMLLEKKFEEKGLAFGSSMSAHFKRGWGDESQWQKDDQYRTLLCMCYLAKADGYMDYEEKKYIATALTDIYEQLTKKEQKIINELLGTASPSDLPKRYTRFSSMEVIPDVKEALQSFILAQGAEKDEQVQSRYELVMDMIHQNTRSSVSVYYQWFLFVLIGVAFFFLLNWLFGSGVIGL